ncbi:histidine phosphatase superfamily [Syncephalis plumigaleata]|nr:histidine phosphatase superfamily [Syncephalis plumigaleata]
MATNFILSKWFLLSLLITSSVFAREETKLNYEYNYCQADYPDHINYRPLPNARLVHVQMLIRHGDRSPVMTVFPDELADWQCQDVHEINQIIGDHPSEPSTGMVTQQVEIPKRKPYRSAIWSSGTCVVGQLTSKGVRQHLALGQQIKRIYTDRLAYLPSHLDEPTLKQRLYFRSTDIWRTKQSATALLTGIWPGERRSQRAKALPLHTYPDVIETMLGHRTATECPRLMEAYKEAYNATEYQAYLQRHEPLRHHLETVLDTTNLTLYQNSFIYYVDSLRARVCHDMPLPCRDNRCIDKTHVAELTQSVNEETKLALNALPQAKEINRLSIGYFLGELKDRLMEAIEATRQNRIYRKFELFSGHDDTVHAIKGMLDAHDMLWPPYASNMLFELWQATNRTATDEQFYLRIIYNGRVLTTSWCDMNACPIQQYFDRITPFIPDDLTAECHSNHTVQS